MCPVSTALPTVPIETIDTHMFAAHDIAAVPGTASVYQLNLKIKSEVSPAGDAAALYGGVGGAGSTTEVIGGAGAPGNVFCTRVITTVNSIGGGFLPAFARPSYGPASVWQSGAITGPGNVVQVYDIQWALTDGSDNWPQDTTGFSWIPTGGIAVPSNYVASLRPGVAPLNGWGFFFNPDGSGNAVLEYVSWNLAVAVERIRVAASVVPDYTIWNSLRFVIISAAAGREATLDVSVNGVAIGSQKVFGTAALLRPDAVNAAGLQMAVGISGTAGGGEGYLYNQSGYDGRFTPAGVEMQPFGA